MSDRNRNTNNDFDFGDEDDFFGRDDGRSSLPDEDFGPDFGDEGMRDDLPEIDEPPAERGGGNRTFIILAAVMILLFLLGLGAILFLALRPQPITPEALTATAITDQNATIIAFGNLTATQSVIDAQATATAAVFVQQTADAGLLLTQTQAAEDAAATQTASVPTITPTPTEDPTLIAATQQIFATQTQLAIDGENAQNTATAQAQQTTDAANAVSTANAQATNFAATATAVAGGGVVLVPTVEPGGPTNTPALSDLNATATALSVSNSLTLTAAAGGPTLEGTPATQPGFVTQTGPRPTALPDTGLFDDISGGGRDGIGLLALAVLGLVGVIVISRRLRANRGDKK